MSTSRGANPRSEGKTQIRARRLGLALALPALLYIAVFLVAPLFYNLWISVSDANGANLISGEFAPRGVDNYIEVLADADFRNGLWLSAIFTLSCLVLQFIIGYALALFFRRPFPGNGTVRALLLVGWILPPVVTGTIFKWMFDSDYGVVNYLLMQMGIIDAPILWLTGATSAMVAVVVANLWVGIPFNMLLLLSGLHTIDDSLYEAAEVDGAGKWRCFTSITEPLMRPVVISVLLLGVINTYKVFDLIFTMTKGGPVTATTTLPVYTYVETFTLFEFGKGAAASTLTLLLPLVLSVFYVRSLREEER